MASSRVFLLTAVALIAFAANSVLCRLALDAYATDPAGFSVLRLASGAGALLLIVSFLNRSESRSIKWVLRAGEWRASVFLAIYVLGFSFAYITLDAGIGALILFSTVQLTMVLAALYQGERPSIIEWLGWLLAIVGFVVLVTPGASAPSLLGLSLMVIAGVAWAGYTLRGRGETQPLLATAGNFVLATGMVILPCLFLLEFEHLSWQGVALALVSGVIASGAGYAIWYAVLPYMTTVRAALVQLSVPVLAAVGGVSFIDEPISARFMLSCVLVLSGIALAIGYKSSSKA
ncbi:MAG: DMT family transporter [Gammaproteobacteria bacterium]|nr:DMT family transporter [Gammaproteobacteria bacterium]